MIKKAFAVLLSAALLALLFTACTPKKEEQQQKNGASTSADGAKETVEPAKARKHERAYTDFIGVGALIAVEAGDAYSDVARDLFKAKQTREYTTVADMLEALRVGKVDAALLSHGYVKQLQDSNMYLDVDYLWVPKDVYVNKAGPIFHKKELRDKYNDWFRVIAADGTWQKIVNRWIGVPLPSQKDIPKFEFTGENGVLRVCDTGNYPPLSYFDANNEPCGFNVEMINRFAQHMGMKPEFTVMAYEAIMPYVVSGKADMSACALTLADNTNEDIIFGEPSVITQAVLIAPKIAKKTAKAKTLNYTDFAGKNIAVITGVLTYATTEKIGGKPVNYNDSSSAVKDVRQFRAAGYMHALTSVQAMAARLDGFEVIAVPKDIFSARIGAISHDQAVIDRFNAFLSAIETDGTLGEMKNRWFGKAINLDTPMLEIPTSGENGVLKVAVCSDSIPYVYPGANGNFSGFSVELALRFGAHEGKTVEFSDMEFSGLIPYIAGKNADFGIANIAVTEERKKSVLFTNPFFDEQHGILALKQKSMAARKSDDSAHEYAHFTGKKVGMRSGAVWDPVIRKHLGATPALYSEMSAGMEDIRNGRIGGYITDLSTVRVFIADERNKDFIYMELPAKVFTAPMGAVSSNQNIINRFNVFLAGLKADGTLKDMQNRWLDAIPNLDSPMPSMPLAGTNGTLRVAASAGSIPFAYMGANNELKGYCIELVWRFAANEGLRLELTEMDFGGLIPYIVSGKADLAIADISITEERQKSVLFTNSFYDDQGGIIMLRPKEQTPASGAAALIDNRADNAAPTPAQTGGGFAAWLKTGIKRNLITDNRWKMILDGLGVTMTIALASQFFGTIFGCFVCWLLTRRNKIARRTGTLYCGLIRGTPTVVLLMITYYIIFGSTGVSNVLVAVAAFTMVLGAGIASNLKNAIGAVDSVEIEAARSLGFSAFKAFRTVTLPQAVRRALPGYTNGFVELVKATAIVGYIAIQDMTRAGDIIRSRTYDAYFPLLFVALIYLIVTSICVQVFKSAMKKWAIDDE